MKTWRCYGIVTGTKYLGEVQADTEEEAREKAMKLDTCYVSFCYHCSGECEDAEVREFQVEADE